MKTLLPTRRFLYNVTAWVRKKRMISRSNETRDDRADEGMCTILLYNATTLDQVKVTLTIIWHYHKYCIWDRSTPQRGCPHAAWISGWNVRTWDNFFDLSLFFSGTHSHLRFVYFPNSSKIPRTAPAPDGGLAPCLPQWTGEELPIIHKLENARC